MEYKDYDVPQMIRLSGGIFVVLTLVVSLTAGIQTTVGPSSLSTQIVGNDVLSLESITGCSSEPGGNPIGTSCGYFLNNGSAALIGWLGGLVVIGPFLILWENVLVVGSYIGLNASTGNLEALLFLIPHGLIEFPAMFIVFGIGIYLSVHSFERFQDDTYLLRPHLMRTIPWFLFALVLFAIAAVIESQFSPWFASEVTEWVE